MSHRSMAMAAVIVLLAQLVARPTRAGQCESQKLNGSLADGSFGVSVDISGNAAIVGDEAARTATIYRFAGGTWNVEQVLGAGGAPFGFDVALDHDVAVVSGYGGDNAYVFRYDVTTGVWNQEFVLVACDLAVNNQFGVSVAIDCDVIVVGADADDQVKPDAGAAYVYRYCAGSWVCEQKLVDPLGAPGDNFGQDVGVSEEAILVGAPERDDHGEKSGAAFVFRYRSTSNPLWTQEAKFTGEAEHDAFSVGLAIQGNIAAVGAFQELGGEGGYAYVFRYDPLLAAWDDGCKIMASDHQPSDFFGQDMSIDEDLLLVGAYGDDGWVNGQGAGYLLQFDGSCWVEKRKFTASDAKEDPLTDALGFSAALQAPMVFLGALHADGDAANSGAVYVFDLNHDEVAFAQHYGQGWPGTGGNVPDIEVDHAPWVGSPITLTIENTAGVFTPGLLLLGFSRPAQGIPTNLGGELWVNPNYYLPLLIPPSDLSVTYPILCDHSLSGIDLFLQALVADAGASKGVAFSDGLQLHLGDY